ncbi:MAG: S-methyl-5-thioribose-1-phosphate isomerase [Candidatus Altiarchaeota archaeon]|nr:S-methyl-5-thioribose-1-phosphate isomerase [Candidatus Altiarchaeota archaeon]
MKVNGKSYRTVWMEGNIVRMIDQLRLPHEFKIHECKTYLETADAIKNMTIRGAPAIGATACYGMAQAVSAGVSIDVAERELGATRPTAHDLFDAIGFFRKRYNGSNAAAVASSYADASVERCRKIGEFGQRLIKDGMRVLTHCNAGWLACVDYGTATAPMYVAHEKGRKFFVWVDETRPRLQGAKLTAWELSQCGIDHAVIADNAAGYFMRRREVDIVIVGADRIAANGDVANKIGTYEKAVLAKESGIHFYVAAPASTFDLEARTGSDIPIEERGGDEVAFIEGVRITPEGSKARNPAFDITPAKYVTGIITEEGILNPWEKPASLV